MTKVAYRRKHVTRDLKHMTKAAYRRKHVTRDLKRDQGSLPKEACNLRLAYSFRALVSDLHGRTEQGAGQQAGMALVQ